jgi:hypothetical protein
MEISLHFAQSHLDSELRNLIHNPSDYVRSMGWSKERQKQAEKLKGDKSKIQLNICDYHNLSQIADSILYTNPSATTMDFVEDNTVQDYTTNLFAEKLLKVLK